MLILFFAFLTSIARAEEVLNAPQAGTHELRAGVSYFNTEANYPSGGGSSTALAGSGSYEQILGDFTYIYDWQPDWRFYGALSYARAESYNGTHTLENSGLNEIQIGAQKWFEMGSLDLAPQVDFVYPIYKVPSDPTEALIGEGVMRVRGGSWVFWNFGDFKPFGYLGFEYRADGRSFLLPYNVGAKLALGRLWLQGQVRGFQTVVDDADTDNRVNHDSYNDIANGGSSRYYSINPSLTEVAFDVGWNFESWGLWASASKSVIGDAAADGYTIQGGIIVRPFGDGSRSSSHYRPRSTYDSYPRTGGGERTNGDDFKINDEQYDENLFREANPAPKPIAPKPKPKPTVHHRAKPKNVEMTVELKRVQPKKKKKKSVDKMLNETENFLEKGN